MTQRITHKLTVGFLGILIACTGIAHAAEVSGELTTTMGTPSDRSGSLSGTVTGGTAQAGSETTGSLSAGGSGGGTASGAQSGGHSGSGVAFGGYGGGSSVPVFAYAYPTYPYAGSGYSYSGGAEASPTSGTGSPEGNGIAYSSYPATHTGSAAYPGAPSAGGPTMSPGQSLMAASVQTGALSTAQAIALAVAGAAVLGGAAYGLNSVYRNRRG